MKMLLVVNVLYYDDSYDNGGVTQAEICQRTFQSKQTVNLIIRNLSAEWRVCVKAEPVFYDLVRNWKYLSCGGCRRAGLFYENPPQWRTWYCESKTESTANLYDTCFYRRSYADPNETVLEQNVANLDKQIHFGRWKWDASDGKRNACKKRNNQVQPACLWLLRQPICRLHTAMRLLWSVSPGIQSSVKHWEPIKNPNKYCGKEFFIGSVTDPYNPQEAEYKRTRTFLEQLQGSGAKISIQTKSDLVLRDIELIKTFPDARVGFSINTLDENFKNDMDQAVSIERRLTAMKILHDAGVRTTCFISPIFPEITNVEAIIDRVKDQCNLIWLENLNLWRTSKSPPRKEHNNAGIARSRNYQKDNRAADNRQCNTKSWSSERTSHCPPCRREFCSKPFKAEVFSSGQAGQVFDLSFRKWNAALVGVQDIFSSIPL